MRSSRVRTSSGEVIDVRFVKFFQEGIDELLAYNLTLVELRVALYLLARMKPSTNTVENARAIIIADALGHDRTTVTKALTALQGMSIIRLCTHTKTRLRGAEFNPFLACCTGSTERWALINDGGWRPPSPRSV